MPGCLWFFRMPLLAFCIPSQFWFRGKACLPGPSAPPCLLSHRHGRLTLYSLWVSLSLYTLWSLLEFCVSGSSWMLYAGEVGRRADTFTCIPMFTCLFHCSTGPHLQHKLKNKMYSDFSRRQLSIKPSQHPSEHEALCTYTGQTPIKLVLVPWYNVMESSWLHQKSVSFSIICFCLPPCWLYSLSARPLYHGS